MDRKQLNEIAKWVGIVIALVTAVFGVLGVEIPQPGANEDVTAQGVTNLDALTLSGNAIIGGTTTGTGAADFASTVQLGTDNNYPVEHGSSGREIYFGVTAAFTGTTTVLSTTSGISVVEAVVCGIDDPDDDAGDSFICKASHTDGDVTITAEQDDGATATEADTTAFYIIAGY
jgi:hypothetical protein